MLQANLYRVFSQGFSSRILLCQDSAEALRAYHIASYANKANILHLQPILLPEARFAYGDDLRSFFTEFIELLAQLRAFYANNNSLLIAPIFSVLYPLPTPKYCKSIQLNLQTSYHLSTLQEMLIRFGYETVEMIEMEGEVSFRGDIIDIYPPLDKPYRISFFEDECEDIRTFDLQTQLSQKNTTNITTLTIPPALFSLDEHEYEKLQEIIQESDFEVLNKDILSLGMWYLQERCLLPSTYPTLITQKASQELREILSTRENLDSFWHTQNLPILEEKQGYNDIDFHFSALNSFITHHSNKQITLLTTSKAILSTLDSTILQNVRIVESSANIHIITPDIIILSLDTLSKTKKRISRPKFALNELKNGDYIVHSDYGIGIFRGIVQNTIMGSVRDFVYIQYYGDDKLLLPVENLHLIDRYVATSGSIPVVDRLGKGSFMRLKEKAKAKLFEIADTIIQLAAKRNLLRGALIKTDDPELNVFKHSCGFELTKDQENAIVAIMKDLSSGRVMDRLLSGDVGFGKTEVAMNAIYAVCKSGFQAALVVPTTLLSIQHFTTLSTRFAPFNIKVCKLDRFISTKAKRDLLIALKEGKIDVVVGTHSLFNAEFKALGLVVVDEEHKFGVKQKESLKELSNNVHILSMSATPIPRTLNMALSHIKGMSRLETPPISRKDSRTFIKPKSDQLIKEVVMREIRRGGQIFYIHNNIASIPALHSHLSSLLPNVQTAILHSQISAKESEQIMYDFAQGAYQILLCTAIIESGIHLPNANTIIIDSADKFGLADLHQLRGRVGRGDKEGFCYFLVESLESITQEATKRLLALERNSYLGSGASIAYHDLEIRGGGNLIGESQSGHIKNIGYGLYLHLLEDAINTLSGQAKLDEKGVELRLNVSAYLSPELIASDTLRLELYRRLSLCNDIQEVALIESEIQDRFGKLDAMSIAFLQLILIKILANHKHLKAIAHFGQNIQITLDSGEKISLKSPSADDDDVLETILTYLRKS